MDKIMITIGRQFGSGGREIGKKIARELEIPSYRNIGLAWKSKRGESLAVRRFMEYLDYR